MKINKDRIIELAGMATLIGFWAGFIIWQTYTIMSKL